MPNWADSDVTIIKAKKAGWTIDKFKKRFMSKDGHVDMEKVYGRGYYSFPENRVNITEEKFKPMSFLTKPFKEVPEDSWPYILLEEENAMFLRLEDDPKVANLIDALGERYSYFIVNGIKTWEEYQEIRNLMIKWIGKGDIGIDWYNFNCEALGTKWNFEIENIGYDGDGIWFHTTTAWGKPSGFLQTLANEMQLEVQAESTYEGEEWKHNMECDEKSDDDDWECINDYDGDKCRPDVFTEIWSPEEVEDDE